MEADFWHKKWAANSIGFHQEEANPLLVKYFDELALGQGSRVFLPLCGKTLDIAWLRSKGHRVVGSELSELAIEQLFTELGEKPAVSEKGALKQYSAKDIDIFVGDFFDLTPDILGPVDACYDRAALVALPEAMRQKYSKHLTKLTNTAPQLLICFEYDQNLMEGPPFSVNADEVRQHYAGNYEVTCIGNEFCSDGLKGQWDVTEDVWLLRKG
ncbi:thiopurine S-methyltransferase [Hahella sp. CCB-MM4]|uniref:thiopurine S-methyltransferase n=1 Tax=Hahella sp. (strain CCB-MM4) TaxID=1926491 RepID=UPI000B9AE7C4|nr:thiopurine S-methyltransferase [Hahella sp. CCB-MM4]OZG72180.1 thiopurine S-methyltransferase [Hahella sp. CCB-MM4]